MSNPELLVQLSELSSIEKLQAMEFLTAELTKEEGVKELSNSTAYRLWSPLDYDDAARKLMSLLEQEEAKENAEC